MGLLSRPEFVLGLLLLTIAAVKISATNPYVIDDNYVAGPSASADSDEDSSSSSSSEEDTRADNDEPINPNNIYAVLVAGSSGYENYRHQADVCHAYQILHRNGVPDENIVVMMVDDIAYDQENPTQGIIINRPNGSDVYSGVLKDYTGTDVTPEVFLKVLLGDKEGLKGIGSGKVLESGPNDHVFINFADHGAPGLVAFPESELYAKDLERTLKQMHKLNKYKKLVFYLEACESGSMFENLLPAHLNIFATTAANSDESSYAIYYDEARNTYLGDVYSVMWMENSDQVDLESETLQKQFIVVKKETNTSHVQEFGDKTLRTLPVGDFLGDSSRVKEKIVYDEVPFDAVETVDVPRIILEKKIAKTTNPLERKELKQQLSRLHKLRKLVNHQMVLIINELTNDDSIERTRLLKTHDKLLNFDCYEKVAKYFSSNCFSIAKNSYVTRKLYILVNMCESGWKSEAIIEAMANTCYKHQQDVGIN